GGEDDPPAVRRPHRLQKRQGAVHVHVVVVDGARLALECRTPLSIGAEKGGELDDLVLATDANGLPTIPGSGLAGVLRHLYGDGADDLFGYQSGDDGQASDLLVSWGHVLGSHGQPVDGLLLGQESGRLEDDRLLAFLARAAERPSKRDRVAINHRGTAADRTKYDRSVVPAGVRFAVELRLWSASLDDGRWTRLLDLLGDRRLRLGGQTRSGLGGIDVVAMHCGSFDLTKPDHASAFATVGRRLGGTVGLEPRAVAVRPSDVTATLRLVPESFWRVGQGDQPLRDVAPHQKPADLLPLTEHRVVWNKGRARIAEGQILLPGSSVKGALAHRVAFHDCRWREIWAEDLGSDALDRFDKSAESPAVRELFGWQRDDRGGSEDAPAGRAGRLVIDDVFVDRSTVKPCGQMHNVIDRFSGGVRQHMLFEEELLHGGDIELKLDIQHAWIIPADARRALALALEDLCRGRLALGAGSTRGHGYFTGSIEWSDGGKWITAEQEVGA
ncbi:MAG TPA: RAMP superfamily CRISPR-associated protein, partial [Xanthomonadaceae bacterium]|nr:RAMP superfamily CRISPR-associated protein [Xanthomonadaceae bacterium]